jgi:hypothetical protein
MELDPEFLAALPLEIQAELIAQAAAQAAAVEARRARAAAGVGGAGGAAPALDMDTASILATFPPEMRQEVRRPFGVCAGRVGMHFRMVLFVRTSRFRQPPLRRCVEAAVLLKPAFKYEASPP